MSKELIYTKKTIKELQEIKLHPENNIMFLHCGNCIKKIPDNISPRDYGQYEVASNKIKVGNAHISVISIWCKKCGLLVWDSRHLRHAY